MSLVALQELMVALKAVDVEGLPQSARTADRWYRREVKREAGQSSSIRAEFPVTHPELKSDAVVMHHQLLAPAMARFLSNASPCSVFVDDNDKPRNEGEVFFQPRCVAVRAAATAAAATVSLREGALPVVVPLSLYWDDKSVGLYNGRSMLVLAATAADLPGEQRRKPSGVALIGYLQRAVNPSPAKGGAANLSESAQQYRTELVQRQLFAAVFEQLGCLSARPHYMTAGSAFPARLHGRMVALFLRLYLWVCDHPAGTEGYGASLVAPCKTRRQSS